MSRQTAARETVGFKPFREPPQTDPAVLDDWLSRVRIEPVSSRNWLCPPGWTLGPREINDSMWFWAAEGSWNGWLGSPEFTIRLRPGGIFMIPKGVRHQFALQSGTGKHMSTVHFHAGLYGAQDLTGLLGLAGTFEARRAAPFAEVSSQLPAEYALRAPGWRQAMAAGIWRVLMHLLRNEGGRVTPASPEMSAGLSRLRPALELIERELGNTDLSVAALARSVNVSEVYLRRMFRRLTGVSPMAWIRRRRVERATILLRETAQPLKMIAETCGFSDPSFFHQVFRSITGSTPGQCRSSIRSGI